METSCCTSWTLLPDSPESGALFVVDAVCGSPVTVSGAVSAGMPSPTARADPSISMSSTAVAEVAGTSDLNRPDEGKSSTSFF